RFFGISDILYSTQKDWLAGGDPAVIAERLRKIGLVAGLDAAKLDACLNDGEMAQALVATYQSNAEKDGVNSTPTLFLNGTKYNNMSFADLSKLIEAELAK
ncbi:MAG: thioredoxin domain-containing protein, partial [Paracoccaceae bacterium]|nr:thioredoxin domain-containing protein [Paracoccaceae bacterium]